MRFAITGAAAVAIALALGAVGPTGAANDRPLIYGMNPTPMDWWGNDPYVWDPMLFQKMAQAGCASARIGVNWDQVEPVEGVRDWSEIDRWVKYCLDNNIEPVILINSTPEWALPDYVDPIVSFPTARYPPAEARAQDFHNWCFDLARRYRGRARYYEFWNEANGYGWYTALLNPPSYSRADLYTPWMIRAYKAVKLADPTSQMSTTGIDDGGNGHAPYFIQQIYNYGGKGYFDAVADHPYPYGGYFQPWKMSDIRAVLDAYGDTHVNIWITEFGYNWSSFTDQLVDYFNVLTLDTYDYVRIATWHTANEFPWEAGYGLMDRYLNPKPEYNAFKNYPKPAKPVVSNISVTHLSASSVRIEYSTDMPSRGLVMYGPDDNYGAVTARENTPTTNHQHTIVGLEPATTYHFRIRVGAVEDGDSFSQDHTFTTTGGPVVRVVSGPQVSNVTSTGATVSWTTDVPSAGAVEYGTDFAYGERAESHGPTVSHSVVIRGLSPSTNYQYRVRSSAAGYAESVKEGHPFTTRRAPGSLVNPGFEEGSTGWTYWEVFPWRPDDPYVGHIAIYTDNNGAYVPNPPAMEGDRRVSADVGWASAVGGLYQTMDTDNGTYVVSGWVASGCDGGEESIQLIAVDGPYTGGIPQGVLVADLTDSTPWTYYSRDVDVTTERLTIALRVSQWSAVNLVAGHFDGISVIPAARERLGAIKLLAIDDAVVTDGEKIVTAIVDPITLYIQEPDGSAGIRVETKFPHDFSVADRVKLHGRLRVIGGEAIIDQAVVISSSSGGAAKPAAVNLKSLGGTAFGVQPATVGGTGLNTVGLLVRVWGRTADVDSSGFVVTDGRSTVRCALGGADSLLSAGDFVAVTGVCSVEQTAAGLAPMLVLRSAEDITKP